MHIARYNCNSERGILVDVHGMSDATAKRLNNHLVLGTRAMETIKNGNRNTRRTRNNYDTTKSIEIRRELQINLRSTFREISRQLTLRKDGRLLPLEIAIGIEPDGSEKFVGDWVNVNDNSLARIATEKYNWRNYEGLPRGYQKPFGCAMQMEMSGELRTFLTKPDNRALAKSMAEGIKKAYNMVKCNYTDYRNSAYDDSL